MRVLLDTCVWGGARGFLADVGHDVVWTGDWDQDPGDDAILEEAHRQRRVLVTLDKDFGELAVVHNRPHHGILRLVGFGVRQQGPACHQILQKHGEELLRGALITAQPHRLRIRAPED